MRKLFLTIESTQVLKGNLASFLFFLGGGMAVFKKYVTLKGLCCRTSFGHPFLLMFQKGPSKGPSMSGIWFSKQPKAR